MCSIFGLGLAATLALIYVGGTVLNFGAVKLFKAGLAKFKDSALFKRLFPTAPPAA